MRRLLAAAVAAGLILGGCGRSGSDQMVRSGSMPVDQKTDGSLASNPVPLTIADVDKQPAGSAQRSVVQLLFWAQWGNLPAVVDIYDDRIVGTLGVSRITGSYDYLRPELLTSQARVTDTRGSGGGQFVSIELASTRGGPAREGFLMRLRAGSWRVVYDTLLERTIDVATAAQQEPGEPTPSAAARRNGARAAQLYRTLYLSPAFGQAPGA